MDELQLTDRVAVAMYDGWRDEENQRRREYRALNIAEGFITKRVGATPLGPPFDLPDWGGIPDRDRAVYRRRAEPVVAALIRDNLIKVGEPRVYEVVVDDPDLERPYRYELEAFSAQAAVWEAARRTAATDPLRFLGMAGRKPETPFPGFGPPNHDAMTTESPGLIEAIALYGVARRKTSDGEPWPSREGEWTGYSDGAHLP